MLDLGAKLLLWMPADVGRSGTTWTSQDAGARVFNATGSPGDRTVSGRSAADFNGSSQYWTGPNISTYLPNGSQYEVYAVWRKDANVGAGGTGSPYVIGAGGSARWWHSMSSLLAQGHFNATNQQTTMSRAHSPNVVQMSHSYYDGAQIFVEVDGVASATSAVVVGSTSNAFATIIGVNTALASFFDGAICEIVVTLPLTVSERAQVKAKLRAKWPPGIVFAAAGQSNMAGKDTGVTAYGSPWPASDITARLRKYSGSPLLWSAASEPLVSVGGTLISPFIDAVARARTSHETVGCVPFAQDGTTIAQWQKGQSNYTTLLARTLEAQAQGFALSGLLWYQGESNTLLQADALVYRAQTEQFFADFRADVGNSSLPIIMARLPVSPPTDSASYPYWSAVASDQDAIAAADANVEIVQAGVATLDGALHLSSAAEIDLGEAMAAAYLARW